MIEKNKEHQSQSMAELQQEMKSLKALLLSSPPGRSTTPMPPLSSKPSIPAWQLASANGVQPGGSTPSPSSIYAPMPSSNAGFSEPLQVANNEKEKP
jgi:peroxin-14